MLSPPPQITSWVRHWLQIDGPDFDGPDFDRETFWLCVPHNFGDVAIDLSSPIEI